MGPTKVDEIVCLALNEALHRDVIDLDAPLELDSLSLLTVLLSIEEALDVTFDNEDLYGGGWLASGRQLTAYVNLLLGQQPHE